MNVMNTRAVGVGITPSAGVAPVTDEDLVRAVEVLSTRGAGAAKVLETGIKPIDLFCPYIEGGTVGLFGIQGVGRIVLIQELIRRLTERGAALNIFYLVHRNEPDSVREMLTKETGYPGDAIWGVQVFWILNDNGTDPEFASTGLFDASTYCSPLLGVQGLYPAIDPLISMSRALDANIVGSEHVELVKSLRGVLERAKQRMVDPVLLEYIACRAVKKARQRAAEYPPTRMAQLAAEDRLLVSRARKIERFLTTPFFVAEPFNKFPGRFVGREQTVAGCKAILEGAYDNVPEGNFMYIGPVEEARRQ
jgi:F0F1-type ATP synthase beta subunit